MTRLLELGIEFDLRQPDSAREKYPFTKQSDQKVCAFAKTLSNMESCDFDTLLRHIFLLPVRPQLLEKVGQVPNVVFVEGAVPQGERYLFYYGGADKYVGVAQAELSPGAASITNK